MQPAFRRSNGRVPLGEITKTDCHSTQARISKSSERGANRNNRALLYYVDAHPAFARNFQHPLLPKGLQILPRWYIEGMAYSISQDPRKPLPRADIQGWRDLFNAWKEEGNDWRQPP
jgi:hypothetical protein